MKSVWIIHQQFNQLSICVYILLLFIELKRVISLEMCQQYTLGDLPFNSFYCMDYCCGNCNFRYCCSNETLLFDQKRCDNNLIESTESVAFLNRTIGTSLLTSKKPSKLTTKLIDSREKLVAGELLVSNETKPVATSETCEAFQDLYGYSISLKKCPLFARYCCGRCMNRYCCELVKERLNQKECRSTSPSSSVTTTSIGNTSTTFSYVYVILILGLVIILAFTCVPFFIFINKRSSRNRQQNNLTAIQNLTPLSVIGPTTQSTASLNSLPKLTINPSNDDLPPAYSTLKFNQNQSES